MGAINLENIQPGMILARDAKDHSGRVLLAAGSQITEKHLRVLRIWGVSEAEIQGVDQEDISDQTASQTDPALLQAAEQNMQELFVFSDKTHPAIVELMRLGVVRALRVDSGREDS